MEEKKFPNEHQSVMPYLILTGASKFSNFIQKVFNAKEIRSQMRDDHTIMHAEAKIGDSTLMFADSTEKFKPQTAGLFIYVDNTDETYQKSIAEGATSLMKPADQDYGRSAGVTDPFGNVWWITSKK